MSMAATSYVSLTALNTAGGVAPDENGEVYGEVSRNGMTAEEANARFIHDYQMVAMWAEESFKEMEYQKTFNNWTTDYLYHVNDTFYVLFDDTSDQIDRLERARAETSQAMDQVNETLHMLNNRFSHGSLRFDEALKAIAYSINLQSYYQTFQVSNDLLYLARMEEFEFALSRFELVTHAIAKGLLDPSVIPATAMQAILNGIDHSVRDNSPEWEMITPFPVGGRYQIPGVNYANTNTTLLARIPMLLKQRHVENKHLYRVKSVPVPVQPSDKKHEHDYTTIPGLPSFLAMGANTFIEMSVEDLMHCVRVSSDHYCLSTHIVYPRAEPTCAVAILQQMDSAVIVKACDAMYYFSQKPAPSVLEGPDHYVLAGLQSYSWHLVCGPGSKVIPVLSDEYVLLEKAKLCDCALTAGPYYLPRRLSHCGNMTARSTFAFKYTVNKMMYDHMAVIDERLALPDVISQQFALDYKLLMNFSRPQLDEKLPMDVEQHVLSPTPSFRKQTLKKLVHTTMKIPPPEQPKTIYPNEAHFLTSLREMGPFMRHRTNYQTFTLVLQVLLGCSTTAALCILMYKCIVRLAAMKSPEFKHNRDLKKTKRRVGTVLKVLPQVASMVAAPEAIGGLAALEILKGKAVAKAETLPEPEPPYVHAVTHKYATVTPAPEVELTAIDHGIAIIKAHEVLWTLMFILSFLGVVLYFCYKRYRYRSNYLPRLFPMCTAKHHVNGRALTDLFLQISDANNGNYLLAYLQPVGLSPIDLRVIGNLTLANLIPIHLCGRLTKIRIAWNGFKLYNADLSVSFPLAEIGVVSIFSVGNFHDFTPERVSVHLVGRFLEHFCVIAQSADDPPFSVDLPLPETTDSDSKPPSYGAVYPSVSAP